MPRVLSFLARSLPFSPPFSVGAILERSRSAAISDRGSDVAYLVLVDLLPGGHVPLHLFLRINKNFKIMTKIIISSLGLVSPSALL